MKTRVYFVVDTNGYVIANSSDETSAINFLNSLVEEESAEEAWKSIDDIKAKYRIIQADIGPDD